MAIDPTGRERSGVLDTPTADLATARLRKQGLFALELEPVAETAATDAPATDGPAKRWSGRLRVLGRPVGTSGLAVFTRQLATMVQAGLPLLRALQMLERQERNVAFRTVLGEVAAAIGAGVSLSAALDRHPRVFGELYIGMVRAGEAGQIGRAHV